MTGSERPDVGEREPRRIRSFVRREGRMTPAQRRALEELWPRFGLGFGDCPLDLDRVFGRKAVRTLEIGFGMGDALFAMALAAPDVDFIGVEVHRPGVGALLNRLDAAGLTNVRIFAADAVEVLERCIPHAALQRVCLFFPDPWHKKRHHKRRLVQSGFLQLVRGRLAPGGTFHMATDWEHYAGQALALLSAAEGLENAAADGGFAPRPDYRPVTKFERRGRGLGHGVWDLVFTRTR